MKKLIFIFTLLILFIGCSVSDSEYVETVKSIRFNNGETVEETVGYYVELLELSADEPSDGLEWFIEGSTKRGKVVIASTRYTKVEIPTYQDGDYINLNFDEFRFYDRELEALIDMDLYMAILLETGVLNDF